MEKFVVFYIVPQMTMKWTVILLSLSLIISDIRGQKCPRGFESPLFFPDGTVPDLVPVRCPENIPISRSPETKADCDLTSEDTHSKAEEDEWRLSKDVIPSHYDLQLDVFLDEFLYNGSIEITVKAEQPTETITLHSDGLSIKGTPELFYKKSFMFWTRKEKWGSILSVDPDPKHMTLTFHLSEALQKGETYYLRIEYSGEIRNGLFGFYRSSYTIGDEKRWIATTQFEPTHARKAFPCFDEPNLKAEFDISITHDKKYIALSNMPPDGKPILSGDRVTDKFQRTKKMSTYLIAFIVSDFQAYKTDDPISSVYANEDFIKDAEYSQRKGVQALTEMEKFTQIRFSLPKIDHVAIPDFDAGAMENWGLITYRDYLLIKRNNTNSPTKQYIPGVISHEVAHQWFGNLVTLDWWSYTWLNEGFATFFEFYITEIITEGEFAMWNQFIPNKFQIALGLDGNPQTSVAMSREVSTPEDIKNKFDQISYGKGGCILRMISELLTHDKFREGLTRYLKEHQFANAKPDGLFKHWEELSSGVLPTDFTFTEFAKSWTEQDGVPVVTAIRNYDTAHVTFTQQRYYEKEPRCASDYDRRWWIPLTWISQKNDRPIDKFVPQSWLRGDAQNERVTVHIDIEPGQWLLLNPRSVGYYRVNYDTKNWLLLTESLIEKPSSFPTQNRAQIINDAFSLASSNHLDFAVALETLNFLPQERDTSVWISAVKIISTLADQTGSTEAYPLLEEFGKKILTDVFYTLGLKPEPNEQHLKSLLRYYVAPWACNFGVEQCIKDATNNFDEFMKDPNSVHPDVAGTILCGAVKAANEETYWNIREGVAKVSRMSDKLLIITALGKCNSEDKLVLRHLEDALVDEKVIPKNFTTIAIQVVLATPSKFSLGFDFMKQNLDKLLETVGKENTTVLVATLIATLRTESQYKEVSEWLKSNVDKLPEIMESVLEASKSNTQWNTLHLSAVADWLAAAVGREPPQPPGPGKPSPDTPVPTDNAAFIRATPLIIVTACIFSLILVR